MPICPVLRYEKSTDLSQDWIRQRQIEQSRQTLYIWSSPGTSSKANYEECNTWFLDARLFIYQYTSNVALDHSNLQLGCDSVIFIPCLPYQGHPHPQSIVHKPFWFHRVCELVISSLFRIVPNKSIDFQCIDIIQLLDRLLDLVLVGLDIHNEHQSIVLLDLLHCALRVEGKSDDSEMVESGLRVDCFALVFGSAREFQGLRSVECRRRADFLLLERVGAFQRSLLGGLGLLLVVCVKR